VSLRCQTSATTWRVEVDIAARSKTNTELICGLSWSAGCPDESRDCELLTRWSLWQTAEITQWLKACRVVVWYKAISAATCWLEPVAAHPRVNALHARHKLLHDCWCWHTYYWRIIGTRMHSIKWCYFHDLECPLTTPSHSILDILYHLLYLHNGCR